MVNATRAGDIVTFTTGHSDGTDNGVQLKPSRLKLVKNRPPLSEASASGNISELLDNNLVEANLATFMKGFAFTNDNLDIEDDAHESLKISSHPTQPSVYKRLVTIPITMFNITRVSLRHPGRAIEINRETGNVRPLFKQDNYFLPKWMSKRNQ